MLDKCSTTCLHPKDFALRRDLIEGLLIEGLPGKCFPVLSLLDTQRPCSHGAWLLLELIANFDIVHAILALQTCTFKSYGVTEASA
jgi:hypothetical protein